MTIPLDDLCLYDALSMDEIKDVFVRLADAVTILRGAMWDRLEEVGYDDDYVKGSNEEIDELLDMLNEDF